MITVTIFMIRIIIVPRDPNQCAPKVKRGYKEDPFLLTPFTTMVSRTIPKTANTPLPSEAIIFEVGPTSRGRPAPSPQANYTSRKVYCMFHAVDTIQTPGHSYYTNHSFEDLVLQDVIGMTDEEKDIYARDFGRRVGLAFRRYIDLVEAIPRMPTITE